MNLGKQRADIMTCGQRKLPGLRRTIASISLRALAIMFVVRRGAWHCAHNYRRRWWHCSGCVRKPMCANEVLSERVGSRVFSPSVKRYASLLTPESFFGFWSSAYSEIGHWVALLRYAVRWNDFRWVTWLSVKVLYITPDENRVTKTNFVVNFKLFVSNIANADNKFWF